MKRNRLFQLLLVGLMIVMAVSFTGCSTKTEDAKQTTQENPEQAKLAAQSATVIAEGKIIQIFEENKEGLLVAKPRYKTLDDVKKYYSAYYTEAMAQKLVDSYVKMVKVGDVDAPVLTLPEDYLGLAGQQSEVKVENDKATLTFTENGKTVTYGLVNQNGQWLVDSKEVK